MGKLLRKLVNGIVPSWLTKIKSSAEASPKKLLLPSSRGGTHVSSHKSSASSPSSSANNTGVLAPAGHDQSDQVTEDEKEMCTEACGENPFISESPSLLKQGRTENMRHKADKTDDKLPHQDHNCPHQPDLDVAVNATAYNNHINHGTQSSHLDVDVDVKDCDNRIDHGTQSSAQPADLSTRKQKIISVDEDNKDKDKHDRHPQEHHEICKDSEDQHRVEHHGNQGDREHDKKSQCMQENVTHHQLQDTQSTYHNAHEFRSKEYLEFEREFQCLQEESSLHSHIHQKDHDQGAPNGYEYQTKGYHDLLGFRTSKYLKEKDGEEEVEEEEEEEKEGGGHGSSSSMTGWGWKSRKGEREVMSCELPESICSIVGNSKAVVKDSQDPHLAFWESMVEMIVGNGLWELGNLEYLLFCYLSLNEPHLHPIIQSSFLKVLKDLERTS